MSEFNRIEIDAETGEIKEIPLTAEEIEEMNFRHQAGLAKEENDRLEKIKTLQAKKSGAEKLAALGLSDVEIAAVGFVLTPEEQEWLIKETTDDLKALGLS